MFGAGRPDLMVKGMPTREYRRLQAYYRFVSNWKDPTKPSVTVEKTGVEIEEGAVIVE